MEIFRKYLWYLLRERKFDQEAADDLVYLKSVLNLSDDQVHVFSVQSIIGADVSSAYDRTYCSTGFGEKGESADSRVDLQYVSRWSVMAIDSVNLGFAAV